MDAYTAHGAIGWSELMTSDPRAALSCYRGLFDWGSDAMPMP